MTVSQECPRRVAGINRRRARAYSVCVEDGRKQLKPSSTVGRHCKPQRRTGTSEAGVLRSRVHSGNRQTRRMKTARKDSKPSCARPTEPRILVIHDVDGPAPGLETPFPQSLTEATASAGAGTEQNTRGTNQKCGYEVLCFLCPLLVPLVFRSFYYALKVEWHAAAIVGSFELKHGKSWSIGKLARRRRVVPSNT
jgi:hypothetical protein